MPSALIVSSRRRHKEHASLIAQLFSSDFTVEELQLPDVQSQSCTVQPQVDESLREKNVVIIYLDRDSEKNACISYIVNSAEARGIRIVSIWLDGEDAISIPTAIDCYGDAVTPYTDRLAQICGGAISPWLLPDSSNPPMRKIKKHTCG